MKIKTRCDNCGKIYNMASEYIGRTAQCKRCHHHFIMNPYTPPESGAFPAQKSEVQTAAMTYTPLRGGPPPPPVFQPQPQNGPAVFQQYAQPDLTILPNAATTAGNYASQPPLSYAPRADQPEIQVSTIPVAPLWPETRKNDAKKRRNGSGKPLLVVLLLILALAAAFFAGPVLMPDIFPDIIGDLLFKE